jgi:acetyltransferase
MSPGPIAIVAQSGGVGTAIKRTLNDRGLSVGHLLTIGNQAGLTAGDYIAYFASNPQVKVIACYLEAIHAPRDFLNACRLAYAAGKPVIVMKLGGSKEGRDAAMAHTGALAGSFEAFDAVAGAAGAIRVKTLDDMIELAEYFLHSSAPRGNGVGALTFSGGLRGLLLDAAAANGLTLPPLSDATKAKLSTILGVGTIIGNPLDAGFAALSSQENYIKAILTMLEDPAIDVLLLQEEILREPGNSKESNLTLIDAMAGEGKFPKPIAYCSMISYHFTDYSRDLRKRLPNTPFLQDPDKAMRVMRTVMDYQTKGRRIGRGQAPFAETDVMRRVREMGSVEKAIMLDEVLSKRFLADCGVPVPAELVVKSEMEAVRAAEEIGFPVVLKVVSADIAHKSEAGGVKLALTSAEDVRRAWTEITRSVLDYRPEAVIDGMLIAPFVSGGQEMALGIARDPDVGCVVMFGTGGVMLELVNDVTFAPPGIDALAAEDMIDRTRAGQMLGGYRGAPRLDRAAVVNALVALGRVAQHFGDIIEAVDINPFVVLEDGRGGFALDGLVMLRRR